MKHLKTVLIGERLNNFIIGCISIISCALALVISIFIASNFDLPVGSIEVNVILVVIAVIGLIISKRASLWRSFLSFLLIQLSLFFWLVLNLKVTSIPVDHMVINLFICQLVITILSGIIPVVFRSTSYAAVFAVCVILVVDMIFILNNIQMHWTTFLATGVVSICVAFRIGDSKAEEYNVYDTLCSALQYY